MLAPTCGRSGRRSAPGCSLPRWPWRSPGRRPVLPAGRCAGRGVPHRRRLGAALLAAWAALDRPAVARVVAGAGIVLYLAVLLWHVPRVPWINHADYADNAVVAR